MLFEGLKDVEQLICEYHGDFLLESYWLKRHEECATTWNAPWYEADACLMDMIESTTGKMWEWDKGHFTATLTFENIVFIQDDEMRLGCSYVYAKKDGYSNAKWLSCDDYKTWLACLVYRTDGELEQNLREYDLLTERTVPQWWEI